MPIKQTIPTNSSDSVQFGNATTPVAASVTGAEVSTGNGYLALNTTASGTVTEQVRVTSAGNVGIGTSSPQAKLDLGGSTAGQTINFSNTGTNGTVRAAATFKYNTGSYAGGSKFLDVNLTGSFDDVYDIRAYTSNGGAAVERMRIDSSGNVKIGTTGDYVVSNERLTVIGGTSTFYKVGTASTVYVANGSGNTAMIGFVNAGNGVGAITNTASTTAYGTSSDYRLKENIAPMTGALEKVSQLKPVTYKWKIDGSDGQGFIAHELQEIVPDCVTGEKDAVDADGNPVYQGIDTSFLVATLTAAIQEQQAIITDLKSRIEALEAK